MNIVAALKALASFINIFKDIWARFKEFRRQQRVGKIDELAQRRNRLLGEMQSALDKKDFVLYEKLFDEYSGLKNE